MGTASQASIFTARKSDLANVSKSTISSKRGSIFTWEKSTFSATGLGAAAPSELTLLFFLRAVQGLHGGEENHVPDGVCPGQEHDAPVDADAQAAGGGRPYSRALM